MPDEGPRGPVVVVGDWPSLALVGDWPSLGLFGDGQSLADFRTTGRVLEHHALTNLADRGETAYLLGQRAASHFLGAGRRLAGVIHRWALTDLPSQVDAAGQPHCPVRF